MATDLKVLSVINRIIQDDLNGCVLCESHNNLVYCELIDPRPGLLCKNCREELLFDDEGRLKEDELEEAMILAFEMYEDEEDEDEEL
jgi:hypothetical protein